MILNIHHEFYDYKKKWMNTLIHHNTDGWAWKGSRQGHQLWRRKWSSKAAVESDRRVFTLHIDIQKYDLMKVPAVQAEKPLYPSSLCLFNTHTNCECPISSLWVTTIVYLFLRYRTNKGYVMTLFHPQASCQPKSTHAAVKRSPESPTFWDGIKYIYVLFCFFVEISRIGQARIG